MCFKNSDYKTAYRYFLFTVCVLQNESYSLANLSHVYGLQLRNMEFPYVIQATWSTSYGFRRNKITHLSRYHV